jgi:pyruvate dehydrogenase E2 component (dihydrolipoamide acetyltransferase)
MAELKEARVPDIGNYDGVPVIELLVAVGDTVKQDQGLVTLESDKATMEVPAPFAGVVRELKVKVGDKLAEGSVVALIEASDGAAAPAPAKADTPAPPQATAVAAETATRVEPVAVAPQTDKIAQKAIAASAPAALDSKPGIDPEAAPPKPPMSPPVAFTADELMPDKVPYASPAVRLFARELGVDLAKVQGSERGGRISKEDVQKFVKSALAGGVAGVPVAAIGGGGGLNLLPWPKVDFAKFGPVEAKPLSRIKKISGANLHRNWVMIPHVTNHDDADITDLEQFRVQLNKENEKSGVKVSMLAFMIKAACSTLKKFPEFNASLDGDNLVLKKYYHIGFAADTPNGLVVPVIRDADKKGVIEIAKEMGDLAKLARDGKLKPDQMQGGTFTISSLGGIGGVYFTPIINAPEVAIMGVCRSFWKQVSADGKTSSWRFMLPLSLSWDHRVIDGAAAARFNVHFAGLLADMRRVLV